MTRYGRSCLLFLLSAVSAAAWSQVPTNGSFETGDLTGWTTGGYNRAGAIRSSNITPNTSLTIPDGTWAAAISTGPGEQASGTTGATNFDNLGGNNDYDLSWLQSTFTLPANAAYVAFDWGFASGEQNEADQYDDLMDVTVNGTRIMTRSSCKLNGSSYSPFPNANCQNAAVVDHTVNNTAVSALRSINLRFGSPAFQRICLPLPSGLAAGSSVALRFTVADQNDHQIDSTLFVDNVEIKSSCTEAGTIVQLTNTSGRAVDVKGGGFFTRSAAARALAVDSNGRTVAFISSADLGGNANLLDQIYVWNGLAFTRAAWTGTTQMTLGGQMQNIAISGDQSGTLYGRYIAFSARMTETDNYEIYLFDRSTSALTTVTTTSGCSNTDPTLDGSGSVLAWVSDCNALTSAGTARRIIVRSGTTNTVVPANTLCPTATPAREARGPRLTKNTNGRYLVFESSCQPVTNGNSDGNYEIFRYDRNGAATASNSYAQVTTTTNNGSAAQITQNSMAVLDGSSDGRYVFFISNGNLTPSGTVFNSDYSYEIFRWDGNAAAASRLSQRTNGSDSYFTAVDVSYDATDYAFERLELTTGNTSVGRRRVATSGADSENLLASGSFVYHARIGKDGLVPVVSFLSPENFLNTNADGNPEVWQGRVQ
ncbi:MAG TPA: choice-of-anchor L domain-containing protein [Tahibacter sp.]|nr:choice-of-anchor L domain-containing protein [Tahibacter sp.]